MRDRFRRFWRWALQSWATRSLAVGAVATAVDIGVLLLCVEVFHFPKPAGAMVGVSVGSTLTFFANRHFAFRDHEPEIAPQALKFLLATAGGMVAHAGCVWFFTDRLAVPLVIAKMMADVCVFTFGQLLVLRYVVFPARRPEPSERPARFRPAGRLRRARLRRGRASPRP